MAGIVAWVGRDMRHARGLFEGALAGLCHGPSFSCQSIVVSDDSLLGAVTRDDLPLDVAHGPEEGLTVLVYGRVFWRRSGWRPATASQIGECYLKHGASALAGGEGSFVQVVLDRRAGRAHIVNDRNGSLPVVFARGDGWFGFGPEAKAVLPLLAGQCRLDREAAFAFLTCGHPVGDRTMFESVRLLDPASCVDIDLDSAAARFDRYWRLAFCPDGGLTRKEASRQLHDRMLEAHRAVLADRPRATTLLLTGGHDSRAVLGTLTHAGTPPDSAVTWGAVDDIPGSDPVVARQIADSVSVPHAIMTYQASTFVEHAQEWCRISEMACDNMGDFAAGAGFLSTTLAPGTVVLIGDQMIGPGGYPASRDDAVEQLTRVPADGALPGLGGVLRKSCQGDVAASFRRQVDDVVHACPSPNAKDVHDYLYFHLYVRRWLFAPSYFREPMVTACRPLLAACVIDLTARLPPWLRVDKRVLVDVLRTEMPRLARTPTASANSLVDWACETRRPGPLRDCFFDLVRYEKVASTPVGELLDRDAYTRFISDFFAAEVSPMRRSPSARARLLSVRRMASTSRLLTGLAARLEPSVRRMVGQRPRASAWTIVRRLALLSMLQGLVDAGGFCSPEPCVHGGGAPAAGAETR